MEFAYHKTIAGYFPLVSFLIFYRGRTAYTSALIDSGATISVFKEANKKFTCPIIFSREYLASFNLLGREGFFAKFVITFEERKRKVVLK